MQRRKTVSTKESGLKSSPNSGQSTAVPSATVVRHLCGTSPFDKYWVNWDCCGLFCAGLTYGLHIYGCYAVTQVLLPPWMSTTVDGVRSVSKSQICHTFVLFDVGKQVPKILILFLPTGLEFSSLSSSSYHIHPNSDLFIRTNVQNSFHSGESSILYFSP